MTIKIGETHILCRRLGGDYFGEHPGSPDLPSSEAVKRLVEAATVVERMISKGREPIVSIDDLRASLAPFTENTE